MIGDAEIRAALDRIAERAPDPARVRAGLAGRVRVYRQRRAILVTGGVVLAAGAVGVPVWLSRDGRIGPDVPTLPNLGSPAQEPPAGPGNTRVPMRFRPTWLPEDFVENSRSVTLSGSGPQRQQRFWLRADDAILRDRNREAPSFIRLDLVTESELEIGSWRQPLRVNGRRGGVAPEPNQVPQVIWEAGGGLNLAVAVGGFADNRSTAVRIARSVVPDGVAAVEVSVDFGWLPDSIQGARQAAVSRIGTAVSRSLSVIANHYEVVGVTVGVEATLPEGGTPVTVRGGQALGRWSDSGGGWVHVNLARGLELSVSVAPAMEPGVPASPGAPVPVAGRPLMSMTDLLRIADELRIGPEPYTGWIWRR